MTHLERERKNYPGMTDEEIIECRCPENPLSDDIADCPYPIDDDGCIKHWNEEADKP